MKTMSNYFTFVVIFFGGSQALAANQCSDFSGIWTEQRGVDFPQMSGEISIADCTVFTRNEPGYWNTFTIGGDATVHQAYGHDKFQQVVRGSWNESQTELTIEVFNRIEDGFHPSFGKGESWYRVSTWSLSAADPDLLIEKYFIQRFSRVLGTVEQSSNVQFWYRKRTLQ